MQADRTSFAILGLMLVHHWYVAGRLGSKMDPTQHEALVIVMKGKRGGIFLSRYEQEPTVSERYLP